MNFTDCFFAIICALFCIVLIAAYKHIDALEKIIYMFSRQRELDQQRIARYEIAIQSLPTEYRNRILQKVTSSKENSQT
jgi:hypothetical protein